MKHALVTAAVMLLLASSAMAQPLIRETIISADTINTPPTTAFVRISTIEQLSVPRGNMIVTDPLNYLFNYNLSYYHSLTAALAVGGGLHLPTGVLGEPEAEYSGFGLDGELRLYPSSNQLRGFYLAPRLALDVISVAADASFNQMAVDESAAILAGEFLLGWQWLLGDVTAVGLGIGGRYALEPETENLRYFDVYTLPRMTVRFDIGFTWE